MYPFLFSKANQLADVLHEMQEDNATKCIGGGTNLLDLMKMNIEQPKKLVDINNLNLNKIETLHNGNILVGALVRNSDLAYHPAIIKKYPLLSKAILSGASPQIRNMATAAGNLMQRTRCSYFFDTAMPCNKRAPGSGCSAINGYNRFHAILGGSDQCIATHPSDMCVALAALDATVHVQSANGTRQIPFTNFHLLPAHTPDKEHALLQGELITHIEIPILPFAVHSTYIKVRDRHSYEFALTSAAVALNINGHIIRDARVALGGVGTKPWRSHEAEEALKGKTPGLAAYTAAAETAMKNAVTQTFNQFKPALAKRTIIKALQTIGG